VASELAASTQERLRFRRRGARAGARRGASRCGARPSRCRRTGGWPAGLRLCLAALQGKAGAAQRPGPLIDRHLFDFLASEVLDELPAPLHDFLLRSSVLPELTAAQAAAVSGDAQAAEHLDEIERRGLFATALEAEERTLVLHDLFRDALRTSCAAAPTAARLAARCRHRPDPLRRVALQLRARRLGRRRNRARRSVRRPAARKGWASRCGAWWRSSRRAGASARRPAAHRRHRRLHALALERDGQLARASVAAAPDRRRGRLRLSQATLVAA
jgi:hypothetical protein